MSEPRIGRLLVASLHQAIADLMPTRLEFYENWLSSAGLREGTIGLAPMTGVLGFLRREPMYGLITARAGEYAAEWTMSELSTVRKELLNRLPKSLRMRMALQEARRMVRSTYPATRTFVRVRGSCASMEIRGSLFCGVREISSEPLCGFYSAAITKFLSLVDLPAETTISGCRAVSGRGCTMSIVGSPSAPEPAAEENAASA